MKDLLESSQVFEASTILQSAATALRKIEKAPLDARDRSDLKWSGRFLEEVDWDNDSKSAEAISAELSVQATEVRPSFYAALLSIEPAFQRAGILADEEREEFLLSTYQLLTKGGRLSGKHPFGNDRIMLAAAFLEELSRALLIGLTDDDDSRSIELT